ncbi:hypothetical protein KKD62_03070 [Patescibacteria group bacterium]|nr:hypothetical protein [Patescibacteria group bacterium]MBU1931555.1 hypothetical protein [Patescibacteria group bacterium]
MGKVSSKRRSMVLHQKRQRRDKLKKLRQAYQAAKSETEKERLLIKVNKIAPWLSKEEFIAAIKPLAKPLVS